MCLYNTHSLISYATPASTQTTHVQCKYTIPFHQALSFGVSPPITRRSKALLWQSWTFLPVMPPMCGMLLHFSCRTEPQSAHNHLKFTYCLSLSVTLEKYLRWCFYWMLQSSSGRKLMMTGAFSQNIGNLFYAGATEILSFYFWFHSFIRAFTYYKPQTAPRECGCNMHSCTWWPTKRLMPSWYNLYALTFCSSSTTCLSCFA